MSTLISTETETEPQSKRLVNPITLATANVVLKKLFLGGMSVLWAYMTFVFNFAYAREHYILHAQSSMQYSEGVGIVCFAVLFSAAVLHKARSVMEYIGTGYLPKVHDDSTDQHVINLGMSFWVHFTFAYLAPIGFLVFAIYLPSIMGLLTEILHSSPFNLI